MTYGAPVWYPNVDLNSLAMSSLQDVHNNCLKVTSGVHRMADIDHLLAECGVLSMNDQLGLSCAQFLASASPREHPSHNIVKIPTRDWVGRKSIVYTL
jgi:hypothetical protein